jgi:hypothetical protein
VKINAQQASFEGTWTLRADIEPGSVPDRPLQYRSSGKSYRPSHVVMTFSTSASQPSMTGLKLESGSGPLTVARSAIKHSHGTIVGGLVKQDGTAGKSEHRETIYGDSGLPDWYLELAAKCLQALGR